MMRETVYIVDEEGAVRRSLKRLLGSFSMEVVPFASLSALSQCAPSDAHVCMLIDEDTVSGETDIEKTLSGCSKDFHVIVMTSGDGDEGRQLARRLGAVICLQKPVDAQALIDAIRWGYAKGETPKGT